MRVSGVASPEGAPCSDLRRHIGVDLAAKSPPDGYTLVLGTIGPIAINASLYSKMPYDPVKDLVAVTLAADALNVLVVHPALPVKNVKELVALGKARPNELNFGSSGPGATDHLAGELFNLMTGTKMVHVAYKGDAPAIIDLVAGNVQVIFRPSRPRSARSRAAGFARSR